MRIVNLYKDVQEFKELKSTLYSKDSTPMDYYNDIAAEHFVDVYLNDILSMKLVCSSSYLPELVLGRLYTEGFIDSIDDVRHLYICDKGLRCKVLLNKQAHKANPDFVETTTPCCTGNHILTDIFRNQDRLPQPVRPILWQPEWIYDMSLRFQDFSPIFEKTRSVHSCYLFHKDQFIIRCEDLGRHNAVDKVVGYALRNKINLEECILFSSGRIPTDMVSKVINAKIPILVTKTSATDEAIRLARQFQVTLIIYARPDSFQLIPSEEPS